MHNNVLKSQPYYNTSAHLVDDVCQYTQQQDNEIIKDNLSIWTMMYPFKVIFTGLEMGLG